VPAAIFTLVIPPLLYAGFAFAITKGGLRMRDGRLLGRQTTPVLYWMYVITGGVWAALFFIVSLVTLARGS
jgi:hypothetical protein